MINVENVKPLVERVDDIPLIYGILKRMGIQEIIDNAVEAHGKLARAKSWKADRIVVGPHVE